MDIVHQETKEVDGYKNKPLDDTNTDKNQDQIDGDDDSEVRCLLPPREGGMSRKLEKARRKVQWNDNNGNSLVEVLEYEPSEVYVSDDEDTDTCICTIM